MVTRTSINYLHHQHFITTRAQIVYEALILGEDPRPIQNYEEPFEIEKFQQQKSNLKTIN